MYTDGKIIIAASREDLLRDGYKTTKRFSNVVKGETWYKLNAKQEAFKVENPEADITEVIACRLGKFTFDKAKKVYIEQIDEADRKASVFYVNALPMWLNKELRNSLLNVTLPALQAAGETIAMLWYEGTPPTSIPVPIDVLLRAIPALEIYATTVYNMTQKLKAAVYNAETEEALEAIELTDYPNPLKFEL